VSYRYLVDDVANATIEGEPFERETNMEFVDHAGRTYWKKQLALGRTVFTAAPSENGDIVAIKTGCNFDCAQDAAIPNEQIQVISKDGAELAAFPSSAETCQTMGGTLNMSPNGRYVFFECESRKSHLPATIVLDTQQKKIWKSPGIINLFGFVDEHVARVRSTTLFTTNGRLERKQQKELLDMRTVEWEPL
jgi:hypothetical protein